RLRQALPRLAVGAGLCGAGPLPARQPMGDQAGDGGAARVVRAKDLTQENPKRDQGGEEPVQPAGDGGQCLGDGLLGEGVSKRQVTVLKELASQNLHLLPEPLLVRMAHPRASLPLMGVLATTIYAGEARLAYIIPGYGLAAELRAIRPPHRLQGLPYLNGR